jgi:hypothetical protein
MEVHMKYMLLIYDDEKAWASFSEKERQGYMGEYRQFTESIKASGNHVSSSQLRETAAATRVQLRNGKRLVTDGPYAETREQLGGYYLIEAKNLDEAIAIAARIPSARSGTIEVRPLVEYPAQATA